MQFRDDPIEVHADQTTRPTALTRGRRRYRVRRVQLMWSDGTAVRFRVTVESRQARGTMQLRRDVDGWVIQRVWT